ncbi:MAG: flippase, partial [bacterium]|nr:flippase [bacterium]
MVSAYGFNFLSRILLARYFGQSYYGMLSVGVAVLMIAAAVGSLGLDTGISRFVALLKGQQKEDELETYVRAGAKILVISAICSAIVIFIGAPYLAHFLKGGDTLTLLIKFFALVVPFLIMLNYNMGILRGFKDMKAITTFFNIIRVVVRVLGILAIIFLGAGVLAVPGAYLAAMAVPLAGSYFYIRNRYPVFNKPGRGVVKGGMGEPPGLGSPEAKLLRFSLPLSFSQIALMVRKWFSIILVGFFLPPALVGLYSTAEPIAHVVTIFLLSINKILLPVLSNLLGEGKEGNGGEIGDIYQTVARWSLILTLPLFFALVVFPNEVLTFFFGAQYAPAGSILRILVVGMFVNASIGSFDQMLQAYGKTVPLLWLTAIGTVLSLVLLALLVPSYGVEGAAVAMTVSLVCMCVFGVFLLYRHCSFLPYSRRYVKALVIGSLVLVNV